MRPQNHLVTFATDAATLAIFDPESLDHRVEDDEGWWIGDIAELREVKTGKVTLVSLGGDGVYAVRLTTSGLTSDERDYAVDKAGPLGLEIASEAVFVGAGEGLPGGGMEVTGDGGTVLSFPNGSYDLTVYLIDWWRSPKWWRAGRMRPDDAPADLVVVLEERQGNRPFTPRGKVELLNDDFLFPSATRLVGPQPGMVLVTTVVRRRDELALKACGPGNYKPDLVDYSGLEWQDTIRFRVTSVDHAAETMTGEFVEKVPSDEVDE